MGQGNREYIDYRRIVILQIFMTLYHEQLDYWNKRLLVLTRENTRSHGRSAYGAINYSVFYKNKVWQHEHMNREDNEDNQTTPLELKPFLTKEMDIIATEMGEIRDEKYAVDRFLSNLLTFPFTLPIMKDILGDMLYESCETTLSLYENAFKKGWNSSSQKALSTFVIENDSTRRKLRERLMLNLITLDANKPK